MLQKRSTKTRIETPAYSPLTVTESMYALQKRSTKTRIETSLFLLPIFLFLFSMVIHITGYLPSAAETVVVALGGEIEKK